MEGVKGKMKGLLKKVNSPSPSSAFKGQGRVLGSTPSSSSSSITQTNSTSSSTTHSNSTSSRLVPSLRSSSSVTKSPAAFDPYEPLLTSNKRPASAETSVECPICFSSFPSEERVSAHIDSCIDSLGEAGFNTGVTICVSNFISDDPTEASVEIVIKLLENVVREPGNEKYRNIRMGNPKIRVAIGKAKRGLELLECVGFRMLEEDGEKMLTMEEPSRDRITIIQTAVSSMQRWKEKDGAGVINQTAESLIAEKNNQLKSIDRKVRVFFSVSESVAAKIDLSDSFYNLSMEELKRESNARKKMIADSQLLIPRSYKEKQSMAAKKKYKLTLIRIQFPDGVVLQAMFLPWEQTSVLYEFISAALKDSTLKFELLSPAVPRVHVIPKIQGVDEGPTLEQEDLVPSALIKFKPIETDSKAFTGLTNELLELIEPLSGATTVI